MHSKGGKITSLNEYWFLALLFQRAWKLEFLFTMPESSSLFEPYTSNQEDYLKNLKLTFFFYIYNATPYSDVDNTCAKC